MDYGFELALAATSNDIESARGTAEALGASLYCDEREEWQHLPFRALLVAVTDDVETVAAAADVGFYVVCRRVIKPGELGVAGLFPMVRRPDLTRRQADAHWRDVHAPLALEHHGFMSHYTQFAVMHVIRGMTLDGFAVCGFGNIDDLRQRFYTRPASREVIAADIQRFADTRKSPRRLIAVPTSYPGSTP